MRPFGISVFFWFVSIAVLQAQILDDSTKEIYSYKTVKYKYEANLLSEKKSFLGDTSLDKFSERGDFLYQGNEMYQNLGVFGTSARPLFYKLPGSIGLRNGVNMFDYLIPGPNQIKYFNTLSPFTEVQYTQGAKQRASIRVTLSQNILPRLNISAHYQRFTALRILNVTESEERLTDHHSVWLSSNYISKDKRYKVWAYYQHLNNLQNETGGGLKESVQAQDSLFISPDLQAVKLFNFARNRDLRNNWYASQVFKPFGNSLFFRTTHSRTRQINTYTDPKPNLDYYGRNRLYFQSQRGIASKVPDTLSSLRQYQLWENTISAGLQDSIREFSFYLKRRDTDFRNNLFAILQNKVEILYGFQYSGVLASGETEVKAEFINNKEYDISALWSKKNFSGSLRYISFQPSIIQSEFFSKNLVYFKSFNNSQSLNAKIEYTIRFGKWTLVSGFEHIDVENGIAFDTSFSPFQTNERSRMQYASISFYGKIGKRFNTQNRFIRVFQAGALISQMPGYVYRSTHWFDVVRSKKGFEVQVGFNLDWRFLWPSENYNPLTGQWFLQKSTVIPPYFLFDAFTHIKIDRARLYFKVHNTLQKVGGLGYFAAPNYPGQRRLFEFGLIWTFFD